MSAAPTRCPSAGELERLLAEELADADRTAVETHVETCPNCQGQLERLVATTAPLPAAPAVPPESAVRAAGADEVFLDQLRQLPPRSGPRNEASAADHLPSQLGPYEILGRLGRGGMGAVYKARHRELDKVVAIKVLPPDRVDESAVSRFRTEMKAAGRLDHPNIVTAHDAGRLGETHYLVTEFVDGTDLARLVARRGPLSVSDACELARQAAAGLRHAHERGLVHRDVKPSNLMLAKGGVVKVLDLGLARLPGTPPADGLTATGMLLGTADYIAPEQIDRASAADARADVYGLGATLYFLLAGEPPFGDGRRSWLDKLRAHQLEPVPPLGPRRPDVPPALAALVESMLAKDPADRPPAAAVVEALRPFAAGADPRKLLDELGAASDGADAEPRAETAVPDDTRRGVPRSRPGRKRARAAAILAGLAAVAVVAALVGRELGRAPEAGPPEPVRVLGVEVRQVRGPEAAPVGLIGVDRKPILVGDGVRVSVKFSAPAYAYLVAFNPDGAEQLGHPEGPTGDGDRASPPERAAELQFPRDGRLYFTLDRAGPQGFVLAASSRPLPPYEEWRKEAGPAPWKPDPRDSGGVWRFDGAAWAELAQKWEVTPVSKAAEKVNLPFGKKQSGSGKVEPRGKGPSKEVAGVGDFFRTRPEFDVVQVVSFPVFWPPK
jgi:hypothetical protein